MNPSASRRLEGQFASLECGDLSPLWPKRRQGGALQGGAQLKLILPDAPNAFINNRQG
jgi:hypothetical protein